MSNDSDFTAEFKRRAAADPELSRSPTYSNSTWPGRLMEGCGNSGPTWIVNNTTATKRWRENYEALAERAGDIASDRRESANRRKAAKRLAGIAKRYLALGVRGKDRNWFKLCRFGRAAEDRVAEMDRIGGQMQRLALHLRLTQVGQPVYVSFETVQDDVLNHRMAHESEIVTAWAAEKRDKRGASKKQSWRDKTPDYLPLSEARKLIDDRLTLPVLSKLCKPNGEIRYMRKRGVGCKVHIGDFRQFMQGRQSDPKWAKVFLAYLNAAGKGNVRFYWRCKSCGYEYPEAPGAMADCPKCGADCKILCKPPPEPKR